MNQKLKLYMKSLIGLFYRKLYGPHVYALITKTENGLFAVDPEDLAVGRQLRKHGKYGMDEIQRLSNHVTSSSKVLIVGAHIGTLAIPISKLCSKVVCIEANPNTYELFTKNLALNEASNCQAINIAASNKEERIQFLLSRTNSGGSKRVPKVKDYIYYYDSPTEVSVNAFSLDNYLVEKDFDVVIMDIEGSEYFALQGMQEILATAKVLAVEFLPHHLRNVSCATVDQFVSLIAPHFSLLTIPSKNVTIATNEFLDYLSDMYKKNEEDDALIFAKAEAFNPTGLNQSNTPR